MASAGSDEFPDLSYEEEFFAGHQHRIP